MNKLKIVIKIFFSFLYICPKFHYDRFIYLEKKLAKSRHGPWAIQDNFRVNHKNERKFNMVLNEKTNNKNKNISAIVKYLG